MQYYENDRSPVIENALAQAYLLIKQMGAADSQIQWIRRLFQVCAFA